jgi:hypothetical protein
VGFFLVLLCVGRGSGWRPRRNGTVCYGWVRAVVEKKGKRVVGRFEGRGNRRWQQSMTPEAVNDRSKEDVECSCEGSVGAHNLS